MRLQRTRRPFRIEPCALRTAIRAPQDLSKVVERHLEDDERERPEQGRLQLGLVSASFARRRDRRAELKIVHERLVG
jgi:hypothetical protein